MNQLLQMVIGNDKDDYDFGNYILTFACISPMKESFKNGTQFTVPQIYLKKFENIQSGMQLIGASHFYAIRIVIFKGLAHIKVSNDERRRLLRVINTLGHF